MSSTGGSRRSKWDQVPNQNQSSLPSQNVPTNTDTQSHPESTNPSQAVAPNLAEAAARAAAFLDSKLSQLTAIQPTRQPLPPSNPAPGVTKPFEFVPASSKSNEPHFSGELNINSCRPEIRYVMTSRETFDQIEQDTGATVITRGIFMHSEGSASESLDPNDKPLHLYVTADSQDKVDKAIAKLTYLMERPSTTPSGLLMNKVFINWAADCDPQFNLAAKIIGPKGSFVKHIQQASGCKVHLRGKGSSYLESASRQEAPEALHLFITGQTETQVQQAKNLCDKLVSNVKGKYDTFLAEKRAGIHQSSPFPQAGHAPSPHPTPHHHAPTIPGQQPQMMPNVALPTAYPPPVGIASHGPYHPTAKIGSPSQHENSPSSHYSISSPTHYQTHPTARHGPAPPPVPPPPSQPTPPPPPSTTQSHHRPPPPPGPPTSVHPSHHPSNPPPPPSDSHQQHYQQYQNYYYPQQGTPTAYGEWTPEAIAAYYAFYGMQVPAMPSVPSATQPAAYASKTPNQVPAAVLSSPMQGPAAYPARRFQEEPTQKPERTMPTSITSGSADMDMLDDDDEIIVPSVTQVQQSRGLKRSFEETQQYSESENKRPKYPGSSSYSGSSSSYPTTTSESQMITTNKPFWASSTAQRAGSVLAPAAISPDDEVNQRESTKKNTEDYDSLHRDILNSLKR